MMRGSLFERLTSRGRNVSADTMTSLLPDGGVGLFVVRGGGPVKRTLSTNATSLSRWNHINSLSCRARSVCVWPSASPSPSSCLATSFVSAPRVLAANRSAKRRSNLMNSLAAARPKLRRERGVALLGRGHGIVAGLVEDLRTDFDDHRAAPSVLIEQPGELCVVGAAFTRQKELNFLRVTGGVLHVDETRLGDERLHGFLHAHALHLEVAEIVAELYERNGSLLVQPELTLWGIHRAVDVWLEAKGEFARGGGLRPIARSLGHLVLERVPLVGLAAEDGFEDRRLLRRKVVRQLRRSGDAFEVLRVRRIVRREAHVVHDAGNGEAMFREQVAKIFPVCDRQELRLSRIACAEREFDVLVADLRARLERVSEWRSEERRVGEE